MEFSAQRKNYSCVFTVVGLYVAKIFSENLEDAIKSAYEQVAKANFNKLYNIENQLCSVKNREGKFIDCRLSGPFHYHPLPNDVFTISFTVTGRYPIDLACCTQSEVAICAEAMFAEEDLKGLRIISSNLESIVSLPS